MSRPGASLQTGQHQVMLAPHADAFVATFFEPAGDPPFRVYVDISTPPVIEPGTVSAVDLDLDVIRDSTGRIWVDDEDEFAAHRTKFGYPDEIVAMASESCTAVRSAVEAALPPYDAATPRHWLGELRAAMMQS
jgi:protein associated with RNAse G/E